LKLRYIVPVIVLVFQGEYSRGTSSRLPADLAGRYTEIPGEGAGVLAVVQGTPDEAAQIKQRDELPFPALADEDGQVHRDYGAVTQDGTSVSEAVYISGRFGSAISCQPGCRRASTSLGGSHPGHAALHRAAMPGVRTGRTAAVAHAWQREPCAGKQTNTIRNTGRYAHCLTACVVCLLPI